MRILSWIYRAFAWCVSAFGVVSIFVENGSEIMEFVDSHSILILLQASSVVLLLCLIVEAVLKHQHRIGFLNTDLKLLFSSDEDGLKRTIDGKYDVSLLESIFYLASGKWNNVHKLMGASGEVLVGDEEMEKMKKVWKACQQAVVDGDLPVWGIKNLSSGIYLPINESHDYWERHWVEWAEVLFGDETHQHCMNGIVGDGRNDELYHSYRTSKAKVENLYARGRL